MNKTKIEWTKNPDGTPGYTWNPITGCLNGCPYCYARKLANGRLKSRYLANIDGLYMPATMKSELVKGANDPFYPRFWEERLIEPLTKKSRWGNDRLVVHRQSPKGIFVCDMSDLFGNGIPENWTKLVLGVIKDSPKHRFYLLTKQPQELIKWSPFPENCWVGVTATDTSMAWIASKQLSQIEAGVKFLSIEPLLSWDTSTPYTTENIVAGLNGSLDWLIIGACTGTNKEMTKLARNSPNSSLLTEMPYGKIWTAQPRIEWVREIVEAADKAGIPVFLKDNLSPLIKWPDSGSWAFENLSNILRQEMPK